MNLADPHLTCPNCGEAIPLTETLAAPMLARAKEAYELRLAEAAQETAAAERRLADERVRLAQAQESLEAELSTRLAKELAAAEHSQRTALRAELQDELRGAVLREQEVRDQLKQARDKELEALKLQQVAELRAESAKVEAQRDVQAQVAALREQAVREAQETERLRVSEKDKQIEKLLSQLDEAKRQAQQGSQQLQGEVLELDFEAALRQAFPWDEIEPVKAGQRGGDVLQRVMLGSSQLAGTIMWELKRTQSWGGDWPAKAKQDAAGVKAEIVIIVSEAVPKSIEAFGLHEGVWVSKPAHALALAQVMRQQMEQVALTRRAAMGKQGKAELLYDYLTGTEFRARLEGIVEPFIQMQSDMESEKRATLTRWKKRERQIERVLMSAAALSGDLQGIGGAEMPELPAFSAEEQELLEE